MSPEGLRRSTSVSLEEGEDLRLVFISSDSESDGSEQLLEWDYFESKPLGGAALSQPFSARPVALPFGRLLPVPFPVPVPVFVPVPWNHGMTEPVLKLYKTLGQETEDRPPYSPPDDPDPHDSLTSSSESTDDESSSRRFSSTFVVNYGSGEESDSERPVKAEPLAPSDGSPRRDAPVENGLTGRRDNVENDAVSIRKDLFESTITNIDFPDREVLNVISQFIEEERKVYEDLEKVCEEAAEEVEARSSAEFSGTESMGEDAEERPVCLLEEGLADDDSWVEELDRDDIDREDVDRDDLDREEAVTTEEEEEEEPRSDREEELRGYHRSAIDFTLHTIVEESCEESEVEPDHRPTELEKYFFYGIGQGAAQNEADTVSETSSIYSETADDNEEDDNAAELASSRLEKYFLSDFMGFSRRDSDGSVGSDSEGKPSPGQRRKRLVRGRGSARQSSASLDNLAEAESLPGESQSRSCESEGSDSQDEQSSFVDGQFDTVKRTKKKKRSVSSAPSLELLERSEEVEEVREDSKSPQPEGSNEGDNPRSKQPSRDSGFMGSCDDLLKESRESAGDDAKAEDTPTVRPPPIIVLPPSSALSRKDSFNNWSSDEETNLMMSKMRAFFKSMVASQSKSNNDKRTGNKPPQLAYFESELTRLMKSVPGIRDEQVKEIVEYLSSEDTWSDSYDSSDYTSSDLDTGNRKTALQQEISASCRQIISNFEKSNDEPLTSHQDSSRVYQKLVSSFNKIEPPVKVSNQQSSPPLMEKVMQHIGSRLVALMHEVSGGEGSSPRHHRRHESKLSTTSEEEEEEEDWSGLPRSKSHDPLMEESRQEASDNERFSWRGSFESALQADSRTRLTGRRSAGDLVVCEELDRVRSLDSMGGDLACPTTNSLPRLPTSPTSAQIYKAHSVASVKSARYRAPGFRPASAPPRQRRRPPPPPLGKINPYLPY